MNTINVKTIEFLSHLRSLDIQVFVEGDRLRCNAPEGILTSELRTEIGERKAEIIAFLQQAKTTLSPVAPQPTAIDRSLALPLSFAQQRLWFLEQLVPGNPFYNIPTALRLTGALNVAALEQSFNAIIERHEALRTSFQLTEGNPMQAIAPYATVTLPVTNLQSLAVGDRSLRVQQLTLEESQHPFDLTQAPLLRVKLLQLDAAEYVLLLTMHHIVSDGWSIGVLVRELGTFYSAFASRQPAHLPALPLQYADFAQWQRNWLQGEVLKTQLDYWQQQLADLPQLDLPIDRPRPAVQTYRGATQTLKLSPALTQALEELTQQSGGTLFITILAAFQILLSRYTGATDIPVGSPIANRNRSEIEGLIGFFVNSLVMRTDLSGNPTVWELLDRVRRVALGAYAHQDLPFERLVEELQPERDLSRNPLFQVVFALQNAPQEALELPGITLSSIDFDPGTTRFDLEFHVSRSAHLGGLDRGSSDKETALTVLAVYNTDLFDAETIARLLASFQTLLVGMTADPAQQIAELPILTAAEQQLLEAWNQTQANYAKDQCAHQLFEAQVERTPQALAIATATVQLTYQELNDRSNQVAHYLRSLGVALDTPIGICVDHSPNLVIGILGILKAGAAYVPLDPAYPPERLAFMLEDAQVSVLLTQQSLAQQFATGCQVVCLDREQIAGYSQDNLQVSVTAKNCAYIIYTSGSTGQPKGVVVEHGSLLNLIFWHQQAFAISAGDRATQIAGIAFDACGWELFPYLTAGASVHFPDEALRTSPTQLQAWLIEQKITVSFLPTPLAERMFDLNWSNSTLRVLLTGGDTLHRSPPVSLPFSVVNNYGLTETTVVATSGQIKTGAGAVPTIGQAIANTQLHVLDRQRQPVPIGAKGELYIGGDGLARGYLNRPELTAERFVPNPFSADLTSRLYQTGDLVRYRANGQLEFLGRLDEQVKLRGYRIELGEIETVLSQHAAVQTATVLAHTDASGDQRLIAYVTQHSDYENAVAEAMPLQEEQVLQWQMLYEETYGQPTALADPTFNIIGWNSSYTGRPLPAEQIQEWVDRRVHDILLRQPQRVLEIGCGTGLLLFRLAPHCTQYWGTDFSEVALNSIQSQLTQHSLSQVTLLQRMATNFDQIESQSFDAVILNSVVQYFPSIEYLMQVLEGAIAATAPGGLVFLGDIRSLPLLQTFHTAVQLHQAEAALSRAELQQRVDAQLFQEAELVIDPAFFHALRHRFPQITQVQIQLTAGKHHNEMTQFRYNVMLHINAEIAEPAEPTVPTSFNWLQDQLTIAKLRQLLHKTQPPLLMLTQIPNARLTAAVRAVQWLAQAEAPETVGEFRSQEFSGADVDPEALRALVQDLPYTVSLSWSDSTGQGCFDAWFRRNDAAGLPPSSIAPLRSWQSYANNPLQAKLAAHLVPQLRSHLREKLPDYMIPAAFMVLESLPLTANGKVDRLALPLPDRIRPQSAQAYAPPRSQVEQMLVKIWCSVLALKQIGVYDNFFELGGHSLLATQLVSRIRDAFEVELPLRSLFEAPTVDKLAQEIERLQHSTAKATLPAIVPLPRQAYRVNSLNRNGNSQ